ncbi:MAG: decarboxylase [Candidatus Diapherotrites archaeon]|nr:decarboxylase [Candidatus Diapherotrites archaeon]
MAEFVLSKEVVLKQFRRINKVVDRLAYSLKTNPEVARVLEKHTNCLFSICSINSITRVANKKRIVLFLQGEPIGELKRIAKLGINKFVVDNINDLQNILALAKEGFVEELFLRIKVREHSIYTGKHFVYGFHWREANKLIQKLYSKFKDKFNLSLLFHRKTQNIGEWNLKEDFADAICKENLHKLHTVNIGGGIPWKYINSRPRLREIFSEIKTFRKFLNSEGIRLMAEPGRFIAAPAVELHTKVLNVYDNTIIVDCSIFNAAMDTYLLNIRLPVKGESSRGHKFLIKGNSPDSLDIFRYQVFLKKKPKKGSTIVFRNAGAYNFHTDFNDLPKLKTRIVESFK